MEVTSRARLGISLFFFTNGALYANLFPRLPEIKAELGLGNAAFGVVVAMFAVGSMSTAHLPAVLMRRFGPLRVALAATFVLALVMALVGFAPNAFLLAGLLALAGFSDGIVDPAQNVHALRIQRAKGRTIINSLHALWSAGAALGGLMGTAAARAAIPVGWHLAGSSALIAVLAVVAAFLSRLPAGLGVAEREEAVAGEQRIPRAAAVALGLLVVLAMSGIVVEDVGSNWTALYLVQVAGVATGSAGLAYVALISAQLVGRLLGDPMTDRLGRVTTARVGGAMVLLGFALAVAFPVAPAALAGFALAGFGCATIVPAVFAAADDVPGLRHGTGVTLAGWLMRFGSVGTSPMLGLLSVGLGLRWAFLLPVAAGLVTVALARALRPGREVSGSLRGI